MAAALKASTVNRAASGRVGASRAVSLRRVAPASRRAVKVVAMGQAFDKNWLRSDPFVLGVAFLGWTAPSSIPVPALGGNSLFGAFLGSITDNLARFPVGPALDDKFWLYMITWHIGLFLTLLLGQVGVQGKKQQYW